MPTETEVSEDLLTKQQIARRLAVSQRTIDYWRTSRTIPFIKVKGVIRFRWNDVLRALNHLTHREAHHE